MNRILTLTACFFMAACFGQAITPLPSGKKPTNVKRASTYGQADMWFATRDTISKLPPIKSAHYVVADTTSKNGLCFETITDAQLKPTRYKLRLPDYKGFEIYFMLESDQPKQLEEEFGIVNCYGGYGNLIVYNPATQTANILTIYFSYYIDSLNERRFYIDKNYNIYLAEEWTTEGEEGIDEPSPGRAYKVTLTDEGNFAIKKIFEPK